MTFAAIDFETANYSDVSICAAGLAIFTDGQLVESKYWLVRPPKGYGWFRKDFIDIHGLTHVDVLHAPEFSEIAGEFLAHLTSASLVVGHNIAFDLRKLRGTLEYFGVTCPTFKTLCTMAAAERKWPGLRSYSLNSVAAHIGHRFEHHNALADAEAAGYVMSEIAKAAAVLFHPTILVGAHGPREARGSSASLQRAFANYSMTI